MTFNSSRARLHFLVCWLHSSIKTRAQQRVRNDRKPQRDLLEGVKLISSSLVTRRRVARDIPSQLKKRDGPV